MVNKKYCKHLQTLEKLKLQRMQSCKQDSCQKGQKPKIPEKFERRKAQDISCKFKCYTFLAAFTSSTPWRFAPDRYSRLWKLKTLSCACLLLQHQHSYEHIYLACLCHLCDAAMRLKYQKPERLKWLMQGIANRQADSA